MTSEEIVALAANVAFCGCACCEEVSTPLLDEVARLRAVLSGARAELARWGWGDFHYGDQPQERSVVDALSAIDNVLGVPA